MGQAQNLAIGRAGMGFWHFTTERAGFRMGQDVILTVCSVVSRDRTQNSGIKREKEIKQLLKKKYFDTYNFWAFQVLSLQSTKVDLGKDQ